jgi:uncharacterized protein (DUF983 family)
MPIEIAAPSDRPVVSAMRRGWACRCPACGEGALFANYLKATPACSHCGTDLSEHRADDAPPYFTMFIVGHVVIGALLMLEKAYQPEVWVHLVIWLPLTVGLSLWLLPRIKGALIAQQWALRMHGFGRPVVGIDTPEPWAGDTPAAPRHDRPR